MALRPSVLVLAASILVLAACGKKDGAPEPPGGEVAPADRDSKAADPSLTDLIGDSKAPAPGKLPSGIEFRVIQEGAGPPPRLGASVTAHLRGWLPNGKVFIDTRKDGFPKTYTLDKLDLVSGLVELLRDMRKGERREAVIPARLAYGPGGYPGVVPGNSDLKVDVELVAIGGVAAPPGSPLR